MSIDFIHLFKEEYFFIKMVSYKFFTEDWEEPFFRQ